ncbi:MAG: family N-acetyltransferase, partial [Enterobacter kobei]|nr:family N-acetyltransferase [Enterobacter kobei]
FFDKLKFRRCEWRTNVNNLTSIASAERIGFKKEGVLREKRITKGHSEDIAVFSITVVDWMVISPAMKAWLRKENFDDRGRQVKKLSEFHG